MVEELLESLREPLQLLLIGVGVLSIIWGEVRDGVATFVIILAVASIKTWSERRAGGRSTPCHAFSRRLPASVGTRSPWTWRPRTWYPETSSNCSPSGWATLNTLDRDEPERCAVQSTI